MPWSSSDRRQRLPKNWRTYHRPMVLARCGGQCEYVRSSGRRCTAKATDVDHIVAGDNHSLENLQGLCSWHHKQKTQVEAQAGAQAVRDSLKREPEENPGSIDPSQAIPRPYKGF